MKLPKFKAYGQTKPTTEFMELSAVSIFANEKELRSIISFLTLAADSMKQHGRRFGHEHLRDHVRRWPDAATDIIVVRKTKKNA